MSRSYHSYHGRSQAERRPGVREPRISVVQRRARRARKQLLKLFPHLATRLHKGVSPASIFQHALTLAKTAGIPQAANK